MWWECVVAAMLQHRSTSDSSILSAIETVVDLPHCDADSVTDFVRRIRSVPAGLALHGMALFPQGYSVLPVLRMCLILPGPRPSGPATAGFYLRLFSDFYWLGGVHATH